MVHQLVDDEIKPVREAQTTGAADSVPGADADQRIVTLLKEVLNWYPSGIR